MAIDAFGNNVATSPYTTQQTDTAQAYRSDLGRDVNPNGILGKDDFMQLLLVELQYQDPTEPMDSEKILTQTSQLAALESAENTNKALEDLSNSLGASQQFSTISAIGKTADTGSDAIVIDKGSSASFEIYFPEDVEQGTVEITDKDGNLVRTLDVGTNPKGVYRFDWDGLTDSGESAESGFYHVSASYIDAQNGATRTTRLGAYPIESVRFDQGEAQFKLGSNYVPLSSIKEVY